MCEITLKCPNCGREWSDQDAPQDKNGKYFCSACTIELQIESLVIGCLSGDEDFSDDRCTDPCPSWTCDDPAPNHVPACTPELCDTCHLFHFTDVP